MTRPTLALSRLAPPTAERARASSGSFASFLERAWSSALRGGTLAYDPALAERFEASPFRFHYLPARTARPGARTDAPPPPEGLRLPHAPCPFDAPGFVQEREIARLEVDGRPYHLTANRFPVTPLHFLVIRPVDAAAETLPQCVHGPEEMEDIFAVLREAGAPYRAYFNSNRGADDSRSGSSVNHWHFQIFRYPPEVSSGFRDGTLRDGTPACLQAGPDGPPAAGERHEGAGAGIALGEIPGWPASHLTIEGGFERARTASEVLWQRLRRLNDIGVAYNLEVEAREHGAFRASLFARRPGPELAIPGAGRLSPNFGGWELTGDIVVPTRKIFDWIRAHPDEAARRTVERLRQTTRPPP